MTTETRHKRPMSPRQVYLLAFIRAHPGCSATDLDHYVWDKEPSTNGMKGAASSWTVQGLVDRGLVRRSMIETWDIGWPRLVARYTALDA